MHHCRSILCRRFSLLSLLGLCGLLACENVSHLEGPVFTLLPAEETGISFANDLTYTKEFNIYTYRNFYNGGGVGIGDINRDGLMDLYLTGNTQANRLYLNEGNLRFRDITEAAGVGGKRFWSTGVSLADINGDGWLDIYVCNSGNVAGDNKQNELFINQGDLTFTEEAEAYGLADQGYSTHAAFFDYDRDGDLDCYLLNNSYQAIGSFNLKKNERPKRDPAGGDKLFRNDAGRFVDVSEAAGIYGSVIGFGLGITVGDINRDGWPDLYISNDFFERDYIYMNQGDGTFSEELTEQMHSISGASMGADMADLNNDAQPDIFVTEMLPRTDRRYKTVTTFEDWDRYQYALKNGYFHQFTRNMLHLNNADRTFSEIGRMAGVHATDWSWGALMADLDNNGFKELFVANGIYQDLTNQDYLNYIANEETQKKIITGEGVDYEQLIDLIPSERIPNYLFVNQGDLQFEDRAEVWGLGQPSHSNGAAYGDLDNDGDLDLVVNNVNMPCFVYRNESEQRFPARHYLQVELTGLAGNTQAVGTQLTAYYQDQQFYLEQMPVRGFQSSVDPRPHFGLGPIEQLDSLEIIWPNQTRQVLTEVKTNQRLAVQQNHSAQTLSTPFGRPGQPLFVPATVPGLSYTHQENYFVDFNRDRLLYHMLSTEGPALCQGDVNDDGQTDFYLGGAKDAAGQLLLSSADGYHPASISVFEADQLSEDTDAAFFDADGDGDLDLYVCSGGNEFNNSSAALRDRLYLNQGQGHFVKSPQFLPVSKFEPSACVRPADMDQDGDIDLFVGIRLLPFYYGVPVNGYLLENDGSGQFRSVGPDLAPELTEVGMITDAQWLDYDGDQDLDLAIVGDWMPVRLFVQENGKWAEKSEALGFAFTHGYWNALEVADLDGDGDPDLIAGNHGWNSRFKASREAPVSMYVNDFDKNGNVEQIICTYNGEQSFPLCLRHDLIRQIPDLKRKYLKYETYPGETIDSIFTAEQLANALHLKAYQLGHAAFINQGKEGFVMRVLPWQSQLAPIYAIEVLDVDQDGNEDLLLGGNLYRAKPETGIYDASYGHWLKGDGKGSFSAIPARDSGFRISGEIRDFASFRFGEARLLLVAMNNAPLRLLEIKK